MSAGLEWINWSHSVISHPEKIFKPTSEKELIHLVQKAKQENKKIKVIGSGHSCSKIAVIEGGYLIDLKSYNKVINFDIENLLVTVQAGISLKTIAEFALENHLAMENLGTIVDQTISGAISTGTHGSGLTKGSVDQSIVAFTVVLANGKLKIFDKRIQPEEFYTAVVGLGALGIISTVTVQLVPNYNLKINTETLTFNQMIEQITVAPFKDEFMRFWWAPHTNKVQYWKASKTSDKPDKINKFSNWITDIFKGNMLHEFGLWLTSYNKKKIPGLNKFMFKLLLEEKVENRVTTFLDGFTLPILVKQKVMEYGIPIEEAALVLKKIHDLLEQKQLKVHMPIEVRFAPKNDAALSMAAGRETCYIGIIAYKPYGKTIDFGSYFEDVHHVFTAHKGRPHWAKVTYYSKEELSSIYPDYQKFSELREQLDPNGMFMNEYLGRLF